MYYIMFSAVILMLLWLLQTVFLNSFYEGMKTDGIEKIADTIIGKYNQDDFESTIQQFAFKNSILVFVTDQQGNIIYTSDEHGSGGPGNHGNHDVKAPPAFGNSARPLPQEYDDFLQRLAQSSGDHISYTLTQDRFNGKTLVYGSRLQDDILYISTPLDPVDSTIKILRTQLVYVTIIALLLGFIIAFFIARRLARPISNITHTAGQLALGNYDIHFQNGYYTEIDELAATLNHTTKELSKVENLRRDLIANMSHDLRTPLTMIKAYSEMILDISGENREKRETHLKVIMEETNRLSLLVNDILELSVMQSGNESAKLDNINLSDTLKKVLSRFMPLSEHEGCIIKTKIGHDLYVLADEARLEQVFYNLIGNAVNYIGNDKVIIVNLTDLGGWIRFEVKDNGCGIPDEELPFIWDRYYKSKTHKRSAVGTGLGLSIVKSILEMHQAKYGVESSVGHGSLFWFELKK
jgi:signal transduction histidine kinase